MTQHSTLPESVDSAFSPPQMSKTLLVPVFEVGRAGVVGHGLAIHDPFTALLTHVEGPLFRQVPVPVIELIRAILFHGRTPAAIATAGKHLITTSI